MITKFTNTIHVLSQMTQLKRYFQLYMYCFKIKYQYSEYKELNQYAYN